MYFVKFYVKNMKKTALSWHMFLSVNQKKKKKEENKYHEGSCTW